MIISVSWRNIWRNKKRSLIIILSISIGLVGGLMTVAFFNEMSQQMIRNGINTKYSHIQIHHPDFSKNYDIALTIPDGEKILNEIRSMEGVKSVSSRLLSPGMLSSPTSSYGLTAYGIDPEVEKHTTTISKTIVDREYLSESKPNSILISQKIAEQLKVKVGSKVRFMFQKKDKELTAGSFRVRGIFKTRDGTYDLNTVFVLKNDLGELMEETNEFHEIAILATDNFESDQLQELLKKKFPNLRIDSWIELAPELEMMKTATKQTLYTVMTVIMLALLFGITNTMLMSVVDRTREIGVLMAVGMNRKKVFGMIVMETMMLSLTGGLSGVIMSYFLVGYFSENGIDLSVFSEGLTAMGVDNVIHPFLQFDSYVVLTMMMIITSVASALYPALKAIRLNPATAIRTY